MGNFTAGASEFFHRAVAPPFVALWSSVRNLTGRQRRQRRTVADADAASAKRRHVAAWKESHER
jgi:hypothetical protein